MVDLDCHCSELPLRVYEPGEVIITEGGRSGALYFLKQGTVEVIRDGVSLAVLDEPGTVLGEISILLDRPHIAEVKAVSEATFCIAKDADTFLLSHPEVNLGIARDLAMKVDALGCYLTDLKRQYADDPSHLGMVHEVLDSLMHARK